MTEFLVSALIGIVKQGETVLIMDRDRPVAQLVPVAGLGDENVEARLLESERAGIICRPKGAPDLEILKQPPPRLPGDASALQALLEERSEGRSGVRAAYRCQG